jgi:hypothetical protein
MKALFEIIKLAAEWLIEPFIHDYTGNPNIEPVLKVAPKIEIQDPVEHLETCLELESPIIIERLRRLDGY